MTRKPIPPDIVSAAERKTSDGSPVAEAHDRVEDGEVRVLELEIVEDRAEAFDEKGGAHHPAHEPLQALHLGDAVGVHEGEFAAERKPPPYRDEEERAARHEPEAPDFDEREEGDLPRQRIFLRDVHDREPRHAHGGSRREERVEGSPPDACRARKGRGKKHGARRDKREKAYRDGKPVLQTIFSLSHTAQAEIS